MDPVALRQIWPPSIGSSQEKEGAYWIHRRRARYGRIRHQGGRGDQISQDSIGTHRLLVVPPQPRAPCHRASMASHRRHQATMALHHEPPQPRAAARRPPPWKDGDAVERGEGGRVRGGKLLSVGGARKMCRRGVSGGREGAAHTGGRERWSQCGIERLKP